MKTNLFAARSSLSTALFALSLAAISLSGCAVATDDAADDRSTDEAVSEAAQASVSFPGSSPTTLGAGTIGPYEPSGLALRSGILYMASDKGEIARYNTSTNTWTTEVSGSSDFESLTLATGNQLMVGVEGTSGTAASIATVDLAGHAIGQSWTLTGVSGMEAMTFVPEAYTPFGAASTAGHPSPFAGYFFIATQNNPGHILAYRLDTASGTGTFLYDFSIASTLQTSDMSFANGVLYVLFDDHNTSDLLGVYVINTNPSNKMLAYQKDYYLPTVNGTDVNFEGITFDGQTIYLGRDNNSNSADNGVYKFANTIIYPQTVFPPLSW